MKLGDLNQEERLALGGLLRAIVRSDGAFSEAEEARIDALGEELGGREHIWKIVSDSAQALGDDAKIRAQAALVTRPEARAAILAAVTQVAAEDELVASEKTLLDWLAKLWA